MCWCHLCVLCCYCCVFFFFKQKTAYEMRISDWSSDVCSSDLEIGADPAFGQQRGRRGVEVAAGDGGAVALFDEAIHQLVGERTRRRPFVAGAGVDAKNMGHRE